MTLRGSVASFPLETIVQLLAATAKTGQLEVRSGAESGTLGFAEGRLVAAVSGDDGGDTALGAVFTISDGDFEFVPWGEPPEANLAGDLSQLLDRAVVQRDKIVADRQVISHDNLRFALSERAASGGDVRLSAEQWRALLAVNGQRDLPAMAAQLRLGRLATLAMLAELVRAGIIEVKEAPPEPPSSGPGSGPSGGGGAGSETTFTGAPPVREWDRPRADTVTAPYVEPGREPEPAPERESERTVAAEPEPVMAAEPERTVAPEPERTVAPETVAPEPERTVAAEGETIVAPEPERAVAREPAPELAAAWDAPPPIPPRETREWDDLAVTHGPAWDQSAPAPELEKPSWEAWDSPTPSTPPPAPVEQAAPPASWDAPVEQTRAWQASAAPTETERDWGLPAQGWEKPAASGPASAPSDAQADRPAASEATTAPTAPAADRAMDDRLSALSGLFGTRAAQPAAPTWADEPRATQPAPGAAPEKEAPPAEEPKKKGGLFSGLFKKDEPQARTAPAATPAAPTGARVAKLAVFANALLDEFNNGQYGKGRVDDRVSNLLMRVDEQADPIDRPLPIVDDRIDVPTLERANMSEQQVAPYLALLVSQIYQDAEHTFGKDKAKRGFKTVQTAVVGDPAALGTDLRLPRV